MKKHSFHKILIANRGEIAVRIIKAIRESGRVAVAIYSENDKDLPFVKSADESWTIGNGTLHDTYLNQEKIIDVALKTGATAIHPGYGFLAENSEFAIACKKNNITFIGPAPEVIDMMGNKSNARETAKKFGVPVIEGLSGTLEEILNNKEFHHYPVLIKPATGGGGKGMQIVHSKESLQKAIEDATRESLNYFGSEELYVEHYIETARHIEVQVLADHHGNTAHLYDRECTLQRRHQKIIEEAPAASLSKSTRKKIAESALKLTKGISYTNAGTIEFLVDQNEDFYFIEMNTRIQVEHPVTEMITAVDIVKEQISIAEGQALSFEQSDIKIHGHSIEARIYAEDPLCEFMPSTGNIQNLNSTNVSERIDAGYIAGNTITPFYDPLIAKIIAHGKDRNDAIRKLTKAIMDYHISGIMTNREFLVTLLQSHEFIKNSIHTTFIDNNLDLLTGIHKDQRSKIEKNFILSAISLLALTQNYDSRAKHSVWNEIGHWRLIPEISIKMNGATHSIKYEVIESGKSYRTGIDGEWLDATILNSLDGYYRININGIQLNCWAAVNQSEINIDLYQHTFSARRTDIPDSRYIGKSTSPENRIEAKEITAPLNGRIVKINVVENESVRIGDTLLVIESMKMENKITAPRDAEIENIHVNVGELVELNKLLITLN